MTNSRVLAAALISASLGAAVPALAEDAGKGFGQDGQVVLSAERLFGLSFSSVKTEDGGPGGETSTSSSTNIALLWPQGLTENPIPYQTPRVALDVVVGSGFTVGGSIGFISNSGKTKSEAPNTPSAERDAPTITSFVFAPRVGYALPLSEQFAFWPRAGVTYFNVGIESTSTGATPPITTKTSVNGLGLNIEPMFVFSPVSHFGISFGPVLDFPLSGSQSRERSPDPGGTPTPDDKVKYMNYGLTVGLLGYF